MDRSITIPGGVFNVVVLISADAEWRVVRALFPAAEIAGSPYGEWFIATLAVAQREMCVVFMQGGWGKIAAAASTQYAIDRWQPQLLVNLGTCGGVAGRVERDEVILVERTIVYDILEQMGDPAEAISHYATEIDLGWLGDDEPTAVRRALIVSADRDLVVTELPDLVNRYGAVVGDWESGAMAWVAQRQGIPCLILRGVTDLVGEAGGDAYDGSGQIWIEVTERIMAALVGQLPRWLERATTANARGG